MDQLHQERIRWEYERAQMQLEITRLQGQQRTYLCVNDDLQKRVQLLECGLQQERKLSRRAVRIFSELAINPKEGSLAALKRDIHSGKNRDYDASVQVLVPNTNDEASSLSSYRCSSSHCHCPCRSLFTRCIVAGPTSGKDHSRSLSMPSH